MSGQTSFSRRWRVQTRTWHQLRSERHCVKGCICSDALLMLRLQCPGIWVLTPGSERTSRRDHRWLSHMHDALTRGIMSGAKHARRDIAPTVVKCRDMFQHVMRYACCVPSCAQHSSCQVCKVRFVTLSSVW